MNVTSIYDEITGLRQSNDDIKSKLQKASEWANRLNGSRISFCEIFGPRWSFIAGWEDQAFSEVRIRLNEKYGMLADRYAFNTAESERFIEAVKSLF